MDSNYLAFGEIGMDILIIDDNVAIAEVLADVISGAGHKVRTADSGDEAFTIMEDSAPDVVFLDMDIDRGSGLEIADMIDEAYPDTDVIVVRSWDEQTPRDNTAIAGFIQRPFTSADVLESIKGLMSDDDKERIRSSSKEDESGPYDEVQTLDRRGLSFGESYVLFRNDPRVVSNVVSSFAAGGHDILLVTAGKRKAVEERFGHNRMDVHFMSIKLLGGYFNIYKLGSMVEAVRQFITVKERPVIIFENMDPMINRNGLNYVLTAIYQAITADHGKKVTFFVCADADKFTDKDKEILSNHMKEYDPNEE